LSEAPKILLCHSGFLLKANALKQPQLEGAWRVVARSLPQHLLPPNCFSRSLGRNADCNLAPKLAERASFRKHVPENEIDWYVTRRL
jgi:hypothetical protein